MRVAIAYFCIIKVKLRIHDEMKFLKTEFFKPSSSMELSKTGFPNNENLLREMLTNSDWSQRVVKWTINSPVKAKFSYYGDKYPSRFFNSFGNSSKVSIK